MYSENTEETVQAVFTCILRWLRMNYGAAPSDLDADGSDSAIIAGHWFWLFADEVIIALAHVDGPVRPSPEDAEILGKLYGDDEALARELHPAIFPICESLMDCKVPAAAYAEYFGEPADGAVWDSLWRALLEP